MVAHIDCEEAEGVGCGFNRHVVHANEGKVGVQSRSIVLPSADVDCLPESDCLFSYQMLPQPQLLYRLTGTNMRYDHFLAAPSVAQCGG